MECDYCEEKIEPIKCAGGWINHLICHRCSHYRNECIVCEEYAENLHLLYDESGDAFVCKICCSCVDAYNVHQK